MKILSSVLLGLGLIFGANAANITVYYSPTCPHCHNVRDFINNELIYEYDDMKVYEVNAANPDNRQIFIDALSKCEYKTGGVPVLVIGEKCFQGYSKSMQGDIRAAIEVDLTDAQKKTVAENKNAFDKDKESFVSSRLDRRQAIINKDSVKKNK